MIDIDHAALPHRKTRTHVTREDPVPIPLIPQAFDLVAVRGDEPYDIAVSADGRRAYVPARNTDNLFVIDLITNQVLHVVDLYPEAQHPLGPAPERVALTPDGTCLLITNGNDESVTLLDTTTLTDTKTLRFDHRPSDVAVAPDGSVAYVSANAEDALVWVIDIAAAEVLTSTPRTPFLGAPGPVTFAPDGRRLWFRVCPEPGHI
jgi:YVTN family beta-propeller protein